MNQMQFNAELKDLPGMKFPTMEAALIYFFFTRFGDYTAKQLLRGPDHPLANDRRFCTKCDSINVMAPAYPGDWFDCLDCGHSMEPTEKQVLRMIG